MALLLSTKTRSFCRQNKKTITETLLLAVFMVLSTRNPLLRLSTGPILMSRLMARRVLLSSSLLASPLVGLLAMHLLISLSMLLPQILIAHLLAQVLVCILFETSLVQFIISQTTLVGKEARNPWHLIHLQLQNRE